MINSYYKKVLKGDEYDFARGDKRFISNEMKKSYIYCILVICAFLLLYSDYITYTMIKQLINSHYKIMKGR